MKRCRGWVSTTRLRNMKKKHVLQHWSYRVVHNTSWTVQGSVGLDGHDWARLHWQGRPAYVFRLTADVEHAPVAAANGNGRRIKACLLTPFCKTFSCLACVQISNTVKVSMDTWLTHMYNVYITWVSLVYGCGWWHMYFKQSWNGKSSCVAAQLQKGYSSTTNSLFPFNKEWNDK